MSKHINGEQVALTLEQILAPRPLAREFISVPEWGDGGVWIGVMNGIQRDAWEMAMATDRSNARVKLIIFSAIAADGTPLFSEEHTEKLGRQSSIVLDRLSSAALRINRLTEKAMEADKGN